MLTSYEDAGDIGHRAPFCWSGRSAAGALDVTDTESKIAQQAVSQSHYRNMSAWKSYRRQPAVIAAGAALLACVVFWVIGLSGGLAFLQRSTDPMIALLGLYGMLGAVAVSIIVAGGAASYIARTRPRRIRR